MLQLLGGVERAGRDGDPAGAKRAIIGDDHLGTVGKEQGDPIARGEASVCEGRGEAVRGVVQRPVGQPGAIEDDCVTIRVLPGGLREEVLQRGVRVLDVFRNSLVVEGEPRSIQLFPKGSGAVFHGRFHHADTASSPALDCDINRGAQDTGASIAIQLLGCVR